MNIIVISFLTITALWLCYWALVRTVVLDSVVDELSRMKANLDWAIINGTAGSQSEAAQILANGLELPSSIRWISIGKAVQCNLFNRAEIAAAGAKEQKIFECSPLWIREMWERQTIISVKAALANSPAWWIPLSVILLVCFFSKQVENWWRDTERATIRLRLDVPATA
ncbi:MAG TPA: hypothetical protein VMA13_10175 [Candidatus Saccharimonadales bacterium]|nr:hypothetical protein [Candidatus Saccharimonadales bacterium]